jgi:replicative superfamily II helicase
VAEALQMVGRAGRPPFDTTGVAVIITKRSVKHRYEARPTPPQPPPPRPRERGSGVEAALRHLVASYRPGRVSAHPGGHDSAR